MLQKVYDFYKTVISVHFKLVPETIFSRTVLNRILPDFFAARRHQLYGFPDHRHEQTGSEGGHPRHRQQGDRPRQDDRDAGERMDSNPDPYFDGLKGNVFMLIKLTVLGISSLASHKITRDR